MQVGSAYGILSFLKYALSNEEQRQPEVCNLLMHPSAPLLHSAVIEYILKATGRVSHSASWCVLRILLYTVHFKVNPEWVTDYVLFRDPPALRHSATWGCKKGHKCSIRPLGVVPAFNFCMAIWLDTQDQRTGKVMLEKKLKNLLDLG